MCTKEYLVLRKRAILRLVEQTVALAVEGAEDENGGCLPGKLEEMQFVISSLHAQADHLGCILGRIDRVSAEESDLKATQIISHLIIKMVGEIPPEDLFRSFDPTMN